MTNRALIASSVTVGGFSDRKAGIRWGSIHYKGEIFPSEGVALEEVIHRAIESAMSRKLAEILKRDNAKIHVFNAYPCECGVEDRKALQFKFKFVKA